MPIKKTLLRSILINVDIAIDSELERQLFRNSLHILKNAGCSYSMIGSIIGYDHVTVRSWYLDNAMPKDPVAVKKINASAEEVTKLQKELEVVRISQHKESV